MASRQDEKERRRLERLEQEQAAQKAAARKRAFGLIGGILLAAAAVAAIVLVLSSSGGGDDATAGDASDIRKAAAAAGCEFKTATSEGRDHVEEEVKASDFKTNPATSGKHNPVAAQDGLYQPGNEPALGNWIHALEHGRILLQYKKGAPADVATKLRDVADEELEQGGAGYHTLVFQNNTEMPYDTAAVAWTRVLGCKGELTEAQLDVMRQFRAAYTDQAPEFIP